MIRRLLITIIATLLGWQSASAATLLSTGTVSQITDLTGVFGAPGSSLTGSGYTLSADTATGLAELTIAGTGFSFPHAVFSVRAVSGDYYYVALHAFRYLLNDSGYTNDVLDMRALFYHGTDPAMPPYVGPYCDPGHCGTSFKIYELIASPPCLGGCVPLNVASGSLDPATLSFDGTKALVPEPSAWMLLIAGFGMMGTALRARRAAARACARSQ